VWIAPTMHGKYYGGGMMPAPQQDRGNSEKTLSLMVLHGAGRLRTLCALPGIFKGTHVKHKKIVTIHTGHEITVAFDRPTPLQIDGETILGVTDYTVRSGQKE
ncbi:MAG: diacylglycerol kinase family protein, partial [Oscillospiraceae bacterium]|nr:diacylglycerol kinase family protein [Oscillospiraceae bacterium]